LVGASASGAVFEVVVAGRGLGVATMGAAFGGFAVFGTVPSGWICASAGPAVTPTIRLVKSNVRQPRDIGLNLFI
jgi:hypothetical protein